MVPVVQSSSRLRRLDPTLLVLSFLAALMALSGSPIGARELPPIFPLDQGYISGFTASAASETGPKVFGFLGIPFAAPPVGELRWRPPQSAPRFHTIPFEAVAPAPACMQPDYPAASFYPSEAGERSEDCLYLNIWTAAESQQTRQPVMVWVHGGALTRGSGNNPVYDGSALAGKGVVVVTLNYRLGAFGYFAHPELTEESRRVLGEGGALGASGNQGVLDQLAALRWVRENISSFGGDPDNVTIFGESAGSWSVNALQATPLGKGLFHKVIGESGAVFREMQLLTSDQAGTGGHAAGLALAKRLGVEGTGSQALAALRAVAAQKIVDVSSSPGAFATTAVVDGWVFPQEIREIFANGRQANVPVMIGSNADEMTSLTGLRGPTTIKALTALVTAQVGDYASAILDAYGADTDDKALGAFLAIMRDEVFTRQMRLWARAMSTVDSDAYLYYFTHVPRHPEADRYGAYHAAEIAYAFANLDKIPYQHEEADRRLEKTMSDLWVSFARNGVPGGAGIPEWPPYSRGEQHLVIGGEIEIGKDLCTRGCDLLDQASQAPSTSSSSGTSER